MDIILEKDKTFECSVDAILHPTDTEELNRTEDNPLLWTMFRTYIKTTDGMNGVKYESRLCSGMAPALNVGDQLSLIGDLIDAGKYGLQIKFNTIREHKPNEKKAAITFFIKNVKGVGEATAERIIDRLGVNAIDLIKEDPTVLSGIKGVSEKKALEIKEQLDSMKASIEELRFWAKTGLGDSRVRAIKNTYKDVLADKEKKKGPTRSLSDKEVNDFAIQLIKENPYMLIKDVKGIGFRVADAVALSIGFGHDDPKRISAGLEHVLKEEVETKGNIWTKKDDVMKMASSKEYLHLPVVTILPIYEDKVSKKELIQEDERVYLPAYYDLEFEITNKLKSIQNYKARTWNKTFVEDGIDLMEKMKSRQLDDGQRDAVRTCIENNLAIVTGGPGVGKTTTLDILLSFLESKCDMEITMVAPTGRAAKRMTEQTGRPASTIHKLKATKTEEDFKIGFKRQVLVVDESSMVDINVMAMLLRICHPSTKLLFVGDVDQLPSIGPGQILRDMIESNVIATARLTKIHRQSADSHIITNAHLCINGKHLEKEIYKDFFLVEREDEAACLKTLVSYVTKAYPKQLGVAVSDIQVLAPLRRGVLGVENLNRVLQEAINPEDISKKEISLSNINGITIFREGDRVIQNKNDYSINVISTYDDAGTYLVEDDYEFVEDWELLRKDGEKGVFNGEIGTIKEIRERFGSQYVLVEYSDKIAIYEKGSLSNLSLAYAITIHKSQGSEFKTVILPLFNYGMPTIYNRNLLYTAITRAKSYCCIIGKRETTNKMIHNNKINKRRTTLTARLNGCDPKELKAAPKPRKRTAKKKTSTKKKSE